MQVSSKGSQKGSHYFGGSLLTQAGYMVLLASPLPATHLAPGHQRRQAGEETHRDDHLASVCFRGAPGDPLPCPWRRFWSAG